MFGLKVEEVKHPKKDEDCDDDHIVYQEREKKKRKGNGRRARRSIYRTQSIAFIMLARKSWPMLGFFLWGLHL